MLDLFLFKSLATLTSLPDIGVWAGEGHDVHMSGLTGRDGECDVVPGQELHLRQRLQQVGVAIGEVKTNHNRVVAVEIGTEIVIQ